MPVFHAISTANQDRHVFTESGVFERALRGFEAVADAGVRLAAYAFMSAHLHLLLDVDEPAQLGWAMRRILAPTGWTLNRRLQQRGGVFDHSFWRAPVHQPSYLWTLPLYINANPAPNAKDQKCLCVGLRSSHEALSTGRLPDWLRPGLALHQYDGDYDGAMQDYLIGRPDPDVRATLSPREECIIAAVARASGTRPSTLCDRARGGKRDRMVLGWALVGEIGATSAGRVLGVDRGTVSRWALAVSNSPERFPAAARLC